MRPSSLRFLSVDLRRSRDGGRTWKVLPRLFGDGSGTSTLLFSPWHPGTLYRFEGSYLGRSTDGGDTWEPFSPGIHAPYITCL